MPYGYKFKDKQFVTNTTEAPAVALSFEMRAAGAGYLKIDKELTARGYKPRKGTRRGMHWSEDSVKYIINNQVYMGVLEYEDVSLAGAVPAIVDVDLWKRAQVPQKIPNRAQQAPHLLTGLLYCTCCDHNGWTIVKNGRVYYDKNGKFHDRVIRYMCRTKREKNTVACATRLLDKVSLENRIAEIVFALADDNSLLEEAKKAINEAAATEENTGETERINAELDSVRAIMRELFSDYYDHRMISREQFATKNNEYCVCQSKR